MLYHFLLNNKRGVALALLFVSSMVLISRGISGMQRAHAAMRRFSTRSMQAALALEAASEGMQAARHCEMTLVDRLREGQSAGNAEVIARMRASERRATESWRSYRRLAGTGDTNSVQDSADRQLGIWGEAHSRLAVLLQERTALLGSMAQAPQNTGSNAAISQASVETELALDRALAEIDKLQSREQATAGAGERSSEAGYAAARLSMLAGVVLSILILGIAILASTGLNGAVGSGSGPLSTAARHMAMIGRGETPPVITDDYRGGFNTIRDSLNMCVANIGILVDEVGVVIGATRGGRLSERANADRTQGVYRKILRGLNDTLDAVANPINEASKALALIAQNDLTARMKGDFEGDYARMKESINGAIASIEATIAQAWETTEKVLDSAHEMAATSSEVRRTSRAISGAIAHVTTGSAEQSKDSLRAAESMSQLSEAIQEVAKGANAQARMVTDTAEIVGQISQAIDTVAHNAQAAAQASNRVTEAANTGAARVSDTAQGMERIRTNVTEVATAVDELGSSSRQIGEIVETIGDIAEQTNLLALNAAIEAARAGEQGKGFAVVADEVRKLAERSSQATKEIAGLIGHTQEMISKATTAMEMGMDEVEAGSSLSAQAGLALREIQSAVDGIVQQIEDVSAAAEQMSASSDEVVRAVEGLSAVAEQSSEATKQMAESSDEALRAIEQVAKLSEGNAASAEQVAASLEEQNRSTEEMAAATQHVADIAEDLHEVVSRFRIEASDAPQTGTRRAA